MRERIRSASKTIRVCRRGAKEAESSIRDVIRNIFNI